MGIHVCSLQLEMRDIGLVIMSDKVFVYMAGADDKVPHFESQGYTGKTTAAFKIWCLDKIDTAIGLFYSNFLSIIHPQV